MRRRATFAALTGCLVLVGCGGASKDLEQYIENVKNRPTMPITPIPKPATYTAYSYIQGKRVTPFAFPERQRNAERPAKATGPRPDTERKPDPLEAFTLDSLALAGTMTDHGHAYALIRVPGGDIYRAKRGDHIGTNYGLIRFVHRDQVLISELVPSGERFEWRSTQLALKDQDKP